MLRRMFQIAGVLWCAVVLSLTARADDAAGELVWLEPQAGADLLQVKASVEAQGGEIVTLAPEGRLLVRYSGAAKSRASIAGISKAERMVEPQGDPTPVKRGLGARRLTPKELAQRKNRPVKVTTVQPNELSMKRAALQGKAAVMPSKVDNSLSIYFPPVRSQGGQGSCAAWAAAYYYNTYMQAKDENLDVSTGKNNRISSPAFVYNLENNGKDEGTTVEDAFERMNVSGTCTWEAMPYREDDWTTWPTVTAWVDAVKRRTERQFMIGTLASGCTVADLNAIKQYLANGNLLVTQAIVYDNFYSTYPANTWGINNGVLYATSGKNVGGHATTIVGYDDTKAYFDSKYWRYGAFLIVNSWGEDWGVANTAGKKLGYYWVGYDYFMTSVFGEAYYNNDLIRNRCRLYALVGANHAYRGMVRLRGGIGTPEAPIWYSRPTFDFYSYDSVPLSEKLRVLIDLTDGIGAIPMPNIPVFAQMSVSPEATTRGTLASAEFYYDFDGNGSFSSVPWTHTPLFAFPNSFASATAAFSWCDGSLDRFVWNPIKSPQVTGKQIPVTISTLDTHAKKATGFVGKATLTGCIETTRSVGTGTATTDKLMGTDYYNGRMQSIYPKTELGSAATTWTAIMLNIKKPPTQTLKAFTIRIKHTVMVAYGEIAVWDNSEWKTVYKHDTTIGSAGWTRFDFDAPFAYDGLHYILVDISFNNEYRSDAAGVVEMSYTPLERSIWYQAEYEAQDPLTWTGSVPNIEPFVPNLRLISGRNVTVTPGTTGSFTSGAWSGTIAIPQNATGMFVKAKNGGHAGNSNAFGVNSNAAVGGEWVRMR